METQSNLRKKSFTIVEQAIHQVRGFRSLFQELDDKVRLSGQSTSTLNNSARKLAQLSLHPHLHCVVPGGGIDYRGQWKQVNTSQKGKVFLFRVENLSSVFRGKFIAGLKKELPQEKRFIRELYKTQWVVYAKEPFAGPEQVIEYLGRYTHKVAIGNHRLLKVDETGVRFRWRDYRDNKEKMMTLPGVEFLRRFSQHILPRGYVRIRHYGLLSTTRRKQLRELQGTFGIHVPDKKEKKHWKDICREHLNYNPDKCPCCETGKMITVEVFCSARPPPTVQLTMYRPQMNQ